jgi:hypothetical protein
MNPAKASVCSLTALIVLMSLALVRTSYADNSPPARVGRISYLSGEVSFLPAGQQQWSQATLNYVVTTGDRIYTDKRGRAEIEFGPYVIRLNDESDLGSGTRHDVPYRQATL